MYLLGLKKRVVLIFLLMIFSFILLLIRVGYIQIFMGNRINNMAYELWSKDIPIDSVRGNIYDRNGNLLVGNKLSPSVAVIPRQIKDKDAVAYFLSNTLGVSRGSIYDHLNKNVSIELIKPEGRKITSDIANKISKANIMGVYVVGDTVRYYPYKSLLASVLGFCGIDNQGIAGIENIYDSYLKGNKGALKIYTDAKGNLLGNIPGVYEGSVPGMDLYLTIDLEIQLTIERVIEEAVNRYNPEQMLVLSTNPKTGEILGMGSYPTFDPENYQEYPQEIYNRNLPIWMSYEPGSTFKILTFAAGLEEGVISLDEPFFCSGYKIVEDRRIKDWKAGGHGSQTFLQVLQNSCNLLVNTGTHLSLLRTL